ncbi:methyltransferase domain-containing protein [Haliea sp. E17]|uniref:methyltransferase domain-containing protein n=1 Tax=Haliea sp. E17 TaxID=3401576 RepID=UPI003AAFC816
MKCRACSAELTLKFLDLGFAPPSNAYLSASDLNRPEKYYPLRVWTCTHCWLVQTEDYADAEELFSSDYAYFSSTSSTWLEHAQRYCRQIIPALGLTSDSFVVEVASNDGYLLRNMVAAGIPCLGIEPTQSTAEAAQALGIPVLREFFGERLAARLREEGRAADLVIANNVLAHVPDIVDFCRGLKVVLAAEGCVTIEFPHLSNLIEHTQFDTVYHEHFSYLSLTAVSRIFAGVGLRIYDVEQVSSHGGSLRVFACHQESSRRQEAAVASLLAAETAAGLEEEATYRSFQPRVDRIKNSLLEFLIRSAREGKKVAAYGAAAKGNTLLNYAGVRPDLLEFVCDAAPPKQGKFLPGSHIPIFPPDKLLQEKPDYVMVMPWNISDEIVQQNAGLVEQDVQFFTAVPELKFL